MLRREFIYGSRIGLAYLVWQVLTFVLGWHQGSLGLLQGVIFAGIGLLLIGFVWVLSAMVMRDRTIELPEAMRSGAIMAVVVALWAMLGQFLYLKFLHPEYADHLVELVKQHYVQAGTPMEEVERIAEQTRTDFGLAPMIRQAGLGAFLTGAITSATTLLIIRFRNRR
jgi:Protein of unknown function (DUF4199)